MFQQLLLCKPLINDWDSLVFALCYHDIVYNPRKKDNEEQSAVLAAKRLSTIKYLPAKLALCSQHILATKLHTASRNNDTNLFTDADLSILGSDSLSYFEYTRQIRKEYSIYPAFMYKPGRKKVLQHFLQMERIYKTDHFFNLFEQQAKKNMSEELQLL
jgi:predicted metal-dependent HD superfamily phosphohydrolase